MIEYLLIGLLVGASIGFIINRLRKQITIGDSNSNCEKCDPS